MNSREAGPGMGKLLLVWAGIGLQSFGGGASTTFLMQRTFTEKYHWLSIEEFTHFWSLATLTPGINLVGLTILIGKKLGGVQGIAVSLTGLLLPSATVTCLLTALFKEIEYLPAVQAIIRGIVPATGAIMLLVGLNFAWPLLSKSTKEGFLTLLINSLFIIFSALAVILFQLPAIVVVIGCIFLGMFCFSTKLKPVPLQIQQEGDKEND